MKRILPTLLITSSLALCVLCAVQWVGAARQWERIAQQDRDIFQRDKDLQSYTNQVAIMGNHIGELEKRIEELKAADKTNRMEILQLGRDLRTSEVQRSNVVLQLEQYKEGFEVATNKLAEAFLNIQRQIEVTKEVVAQRDDFVNQLNQSREDYNKMVRQYNELVENIKKEREAEAAAAGGKPGK